MIQLFAWPPAFDLPSLDPACLSVEAYLQFAGADWAVQNVNAPNLSPTGELPFIRDGIRPIAGAEYIIAYLKRKGFDLDSHLTALEAAECLSYITLIEDKLFDALLYSRWVDAENFAQSTRPMMSKSMGWITRNYLPSQLRDRAKGRLAAYRTITVDGEPVNEVYSVARDIFKALAAKLGDKPYFLGNHPTSLDAIAFGHLALHAVPSVKNPRLFSILTFEFPTLIAYCDRIKRELFSTPVKVSPNIEPVSLASDFVTRPSHYASLAWGYVGGWLRRFTSDDALVRDGGSGGGGESAAAAQTAAYTEKEEAIRARRRDAFYKVLSSVGATAVFAFYVWYHGIIEIRTADDDDDDDASSETTE